VTDIEGSWLIEVAPNYYSLDNFPTGEAKRSLERMYQRSQMAAKFKGNKQ